MPQKNIEPEDQRTFDLALRLLQSGKLAEAEGLFQQVLARNPLHADSLHLLGVVKAQMGLSAEALDLIDRALKINDAVPFYHNNIGKVLKDVGRLDEAIEHLKRAVALLPTYVDAINNLGTAFHARHQYADAKALFERVLELQPDYADSHNNLGGVFLLMGERDAALKHYARARELKPQCSETFYNLIVARFVGTPVKMWGDLCREALGFEGLAAIYRFDALVRLAVHRWAVGDVSGTVEALKLSQPLPWATGKMRDEIVRNTQAYRNILVELLTFYASSGFRPRFAEKEAAIIGDSHCMSFANTTLDVEGTPHKIVPHLVMGCKAWHLAQPPFNIYKWELREILERLPPGAKCLVSVGEIDCRHTEGIMAHFRKTGGNLNDIISNTARDYARYVAAVMKSKDARFSFINVPAPYVDKLHRHYPDFSSSDEELLIKVIRGFNATLKEEAAGLNVPVVDVYRLTVNPQGIAEGRHHLDGYHLKPNALVSAMGEA